MGWGSCTFLKVRQCAASSASFVYVLRSDGTFLTRLDEFLEMMKRIKDTAGFYLSNSYRSENGLIHVVFLDLRITFVSPLISQSANRCEEAKWRTRQTERARGKRKTRNIEGIASSVCEDRKRHCHTWLNEA